MAWPPQFQSLFQGQRRWEGKAGEGRKEKRKNAKLPLDKESNDVWEHLLFFWLPSASSLLTMKITYFNHKSKVYFLQDNNNECSSTQLPFASWPLACTWLIKAVTHMFIYNIVVKSTNSGDKPAYIQISILLTSSSVILGK